MDQYIGKLLDNRYEILELIGMGGMAKVYKARCHRLNRFVAVKILRDDLAQDEEFRRRFRDESQAVAMLSHPNIVAVYDVSRNSDFEYIVMELIDGITLKQYMQRKGNKLNWREALHFITQIVKALGHAHSRGIIHRDIKPHNIMVLRDGSVKVADFGIARLISAGHGTLTQEALGSVHYISPEQARGSHIDARSDLYSAGVVLYEMVTGRLPFEGDSPVSVAIQHINSIPLSPRELNPEVPEALEAITMKAMAPVVDNRYISADAMLADLEEFRKNPSISLDYSVNVSEFQVAAPEPVVEEEVEVEEKTQILPSNTGSLSMRQRAEQEEEQAPPAKKERKSRRKREKEREESDYEDYDDYDDYDQRRGPVWPIFLAVVAILGFTVSVFYFLYTSFIYDILNPAPAYKIPNLVGRVYEEVVDNYAIVQDFRIIVGAAQESEEPAGTILKQSPNANTGTQDSGAVITITISSGPEVLIMPDVTNADYHQALVMLQNMGFVVAAPESRYDEEVASNRVISFTPVVGTVMRPGSTVQLVISKGPEPRESTVISFVGRTEEWTRNKMALLGLEVGAVKQVWSEVHEPGMVVNQSVAAGTVVLEGTRVDLQISKGMDPSTQPEPYTHTFQIYLPLEPMELQVTVMEDDEVILNQTVNSAMEAIVPCTVTDFGVRTYEIYFDGVLQYTETVDFEAWRQTAVPIQPGMPGWLGGEEG